MTGDSFTVYIVCISPQMNKNSTAFTETVHTRKSNILPYFIYFFPAINSSQLCFDFSICFQRSHVIRHQFTRPPALRTDVPSASFALFHLAWQPHASHLGAERAARRLSSAARWRRRQGDGLRRWRLHTFSKASAEGLNDEARKIENIGACRSGTNERFFFFFLHVPRRIVELETKGEWEVGKNTTNERHQIKICLNGATLICSVRLGDADEGNLKGVWQHERSRLCSFKQRESVNKQHLCFLPGTFHPRLWNIWNASQTREKCCPTYTQSHFLRVSRHSNNTKKTKKL